MVSNPVFQIRTLTVEGVKHKFCQVSPSNLRFSPTTFVDEISAMSQSEEYIGEQLIMTTFTRNFTLEPCVITRQSINAHSQLLLAPDYFRPLLIHYTPLSLHTSTMNLHQTGVEELSLDRRIQQVTELLLTRFLSLLTLP
jgi:hypothetical protein